MNRLSSGILEAIARYKKHSDKNKATEEILELFTKQQNDNSPPVSPARYRLPQDRQGITGKLVIHPEGGGDPNLYYVTVSYYPDGTLGEIFVTQQKEGETVGAYLDAVATAVSVGLQHGIPWETFAKKFSHQRFAPSGITEDDDPTLKFVASPLDYLARWVDSRIKEGNGKPTCVRRSEDSEGS